MLHVWLKMSRTKRPMKPCRMRNVTNARDVRRPGLIHGNSNTTFIIHNNWNDNNKKKKNTTTTNNDNTNNVDYAQVEGQVPLVLRG